jgi:hypothetical protein
MIGVDLTKIAEYRKDLPEMTLLWAEIKQAELAHIAAIRTIIDAGNP